MAVHEAGQEHTAVGLDDGGVGGCGEARADGGDATVGDEHIASRDNAQLAERGTAAGFGPAGQP